MREGIADIDASAASPQRVRTAELLPVGQPVAEYRDQTFQNSFLHQSVERSVHKEGGGELEDWMREGQNNEEARWEITHLRAKEGKQASSSHCLLGILEYYSPPPPQGPP